MKSFMRHWGNLSWWAEFPVGRCCENSPHHRHSESA